MEKLKRCICSVTALFCSQPHDTVATLLSLLVTPNNVKEEKFGFQR